MKGISFFLSVNALPDDKSVGKVLMEIQNIYVEYLFETIAAEERRVFSLVLYGDRLMPLRRINLNSFVRFSK